MPALFPDAELFKHAEVRPENELMLLCARVHAGEEAVGRIRELAQARIDWDYLYRLAQRHAALPLLYRGLETSALADVPQDFKKKLRENFRDNATRNLLLAGELVRITRLFESEGLPVLAYKGPALAVQAYGQLSLRRFIDLDVIVRRRDVGRAGVLLQSLGFSKPEGLTRAQEEFLLKHQHNLAFTRDAGRLSVELHWELAPARFASVPLGEAVWQRAVAVGLSGGEVKSLSPEDLLLALCVHGTKHLWERLAWVCDVAALLNSQTNLDWSLIARRARDSRVERMLYLGLCLARGLAGASVPDEQLPMHTEREVRGLAVEVTKGFFDGDVYEPASFAQNVRFNLHARAGLREKIEYLRFILTPTDGDLTALSLPGSMSFIYYVLRPFRLVSKRTAGH
ncbi:MAG: hypothetical protein QOH51_2429 [Acidobacteriota bacterium]|jgi:hypothetical protein|nr:hypothetical protein [Acidobacteriota bacterium]